MATESNMVAAAEHNFLCYEGDTTPAVLTFIQNELPLDFTGAVILMEVKKTKGSAQNVFVFGTAEANIVVSGADDNILTITGWQNLVSGLYYYDLQVTISGATTTYLTGTITVQKGVSD